ncbi:hypothetical protein AALP_AA7G040900 [Arabis alpina]|uniref:TIR domain-containing protein n=1 Tax=Arabis alpina TaxID=50452 RepID=A0A087GFT9_ARAAL|nr:hypothetical protein AALP_AA7G040900 [Arabis alpina]
MASSSSSSSSLSRTWRYRVFTSFHGKDVRTTFLSHLRKQFEYNGISMFDDQGIERSQTIPLALTRAIRESRISIVVLSKNFASSSWCLKELVEILECKKDMGQIVMTIFYGVDPSDVRKQTGDFGKVFKKTCSRKTEVERRRWSKALTEVGNIAGEHFLNWDNEAKMIETIAKDVLNKLNVSPSRDFDDMVGLEAHLREMESLLDLDYEGVKMVAISGPAGIGKTTIAKALCNRLSSSFQLTCFVDILRESDHNGFDEHGSKLHLQEQFLSKVLNHNGTRICHLGAIKDNLCDQKVLIILDDVNHLKQLEALANETAWFGPGSRIVVTTENKELLQQHGINNTYLVELPSYVMPSNVNMLLCKYAFTQCPPNYCFNKFFQRITALCGNLPLGLRVVGLSLRGKEEDEWEDVMNRLETILDRDIEDVLRVGYDSLDENEQTLFLHIAVFFDCKYTDLVKAMFAKGNLDVKRGLKILAYRSLIEISTDGILIQMHRLLQQMAIKAIRKQEPWKRQILMDAHEICDVLENETGTSVVSGISFDISGINEVIVSKRALKRMSNLQFLKVYKRRDDWNDRMFTHEEMEFPRQLRLLHWEAYPSKCLPLTFISEYLVELHMRHSKLEYLWQGTRQLKNLKKMDLSWSYHLKELPNLSNATNLVEMNMLRCESLVEIPSSFRHLQKLEILWMDDCINLQVIPSDLNLASLGFISMSGCSKLRNFSIISAKLGMVNISDTSLEDVPLSISPSLHLIGLSIENSRNLKEITHLPTSLQILDLSYSSIEKIPDCIIALHRIELLRLNGCRKLESLPELPSSLEILMAAGCESLETVFFPLNHARDAELIFTGCFKLSEQGRRAIIQSLPFCKKAILPGREVPVEFDHRAKGNLLTIRPHGNNTLSALSRLRFCVVVSPNHQIGGFCKDLLLCRRIEAGDLDVDPVKENVRVDIGFYRAEHLVIFDSCLPFIDPSEVSREIVFEFSSTCHNFDIIECGAQVWTDKTLEGSYESELDQVFEDGYGSLTNGSYEFELSEAFEDDTKYGDNTNGIVICDEILEGQERTYFWSWLFLCFDCLPFCQKH